MKKTQSISRRQVLKGATATAAVAAFPALGATIMPSGLKRIQGANDKVVLGLIGCGGMGAANMRTLMGHADVGVAALCDVDSKRIPGDFGEVAKKYGRNPSVYEDYRKMLEQKDIDAVIIGTPDHWHALNLVHACEAGKDIYCEKPISHNIVEAIAMVNAQRKFKRVVQVGTWQRSTREFTDAIDFIRTGKLGKIVLTRAWITDGTKLGRVRPSAVPEGLNYDMWCGPAEMPPYQSNIVHWNWRWMMNTGGGLTTDWGVHMIDIALLGLSKTQDLPMPVNASAVGGRWAIQNDDRTAPDTQEAILCFKNPDFALHWSVGRDHPGKPGHGTEFVSDDGKTLRVWRGGWTVLDPDGKELPKVQADPVSDHWKNWLDCIKTRERPRADLASVAQTTIVCHLINAAWYSGEKVRWDAAANDIKGNVGKDTLAYRRPYRKPWKLVNHRP